MTFRVVHFGYSDITPGAALAAYLVHHGLLTQNHDSWMVVARKMGTDPRVLSFNSAGGDLWGRVVFQADILPKRFAYYLPNPVMSPMEPDSALAWVGTGLVRRVVRLLPDIDRKSVV